MAHARTQIRAQVIAALVGLPTTGNRERESVLRYPAPDAVLIRVRERELSHR